MGVPDRPATIEYAPAVPLAVAVTEASPCALVVTDVLLSVADAPLDGTEKTTVAPTNGKPLLSRTRTASAVPNAALSPAP
jgi:hypothetical protein